MRRIFKKILAPIMVLGLAITLWACTSKVNTKIIFDSNDGSYVAESTTKVETEPVPTKKGYVFEGWYTTNDFKDEKVTFPFDLGKENITLYAKWKLENYTITYHLNGGTNHTSNPNSYTVEDTVTLNNPTHTTKDFDGWYQDIEFKTAVSSIAKGSTGNVNFYAKWKDKEVVSETYDITYHLDGGTNANTNPASYTKGTAVTLLDATKPGHKFEGWYLEASFTNKATGVSAEDMGNKVFYAKFVADTYTITYHLEGGTNANTNPTSYTYGTIVTLENPSKEGYSFTGWYLEDSFTNKVTGVSAEDMGDKVFYAKFVADSYIITYHLDGGTNSTKNPATYKVDDAFKFANPTQDRMVFKGWYTDAEFKNKITEIVAGSTGNLDLYAKWEEVAYVIHYHLDDGENHHDNPAGYSTGQVVTFEPAEKAGYTFEGWYQDIEFKNKITNIAEDASGDLDVYAKFTLEAYTITYHLDGGTNASTNPATYNVTSTVVLADASKASYTFTGWYLEASFTNKVTNLVLGTTGAKEFYAKFTNDYDLMYGDWSKDNYMLFASLSREAFTYNGTSYAYTMTDFTSNKITALNDKIYFTYNPTEDTITFVREYLRSEDDLDPSIETSTLSKITLADTASFAGTYYTGDSRTVRDLVFDAFGHVTRFAGADTYQGLFSVENGVVTLQYKTNNQGSWIMYTGTLENGVLTLNKDDVTSIYVKNDSPTIYADNTGNVVYKYTNLYVLEKDNVDYVATMTGEFAVGSFVTFTYADTSVKFRVVSLAGASWGTLESAGETAGEYTFSDSSDVLVLDGFGPTNGRLGDAKLNDADVSYAMLGYMQNILIIYPNSTEKYYHMDGRVLTEVTVSDGMEGKYVFNTSYYLVSGLGYYKRSGAEYYELYEYNSTTNTIKLNSTTYTIYHNGNVLSTGSSHYVKEDYSVATKDFTDYLDTVYENTLHQVKVRVTKDSPAYKVVVLETVTLNGVELTATTYDAVYVLDRLVFNGVELVLSDTLDLVVAEETYPLTEFVPEKTLAEKVVGVYVNGNYYVRVYNEEGTLKACYGSSINPYSQPSSYTCTITDEDNGKLQFTPYSSAYDFTYSEVENVGRITFGTSTDIDSSYRGKEFVSYDDSTVELRAVLGTSITAGGYAPGASTLAKIYENNELKSWTNISYSRTLTAEERNTVGVIDVEVYAWVYGKKHTVTSQLAVVESWDISVSKSSLTIKVTSENYTKADVVALGMFTPKHNGTAVEVTEDMISLPTGFDTTKVGSYTISCMYHEITKTATLVVEADPYNYTFGRYKYSTTSGLYLYVENGTGKAEYYSSLMSNSATYETSYTKKGTFTISTAATNNLLITIGDYTYTYTAQISNNAVTSLKFVSVSSGYSPISYLKNTYDSYNPTVSFEGLTHADVSCGSVSSSESNFRTGYFKLLVDGSDKTSSIKVSTYPTSTEVKTPGTYTLEAFYWICGIKYEATTTVKFVDSYTLEPVSTKSVEVLVDTEVDYYALFKLTHNGTVEALTSQNCNIDVSSVNMAVPGDYVVTCTFGEMSKTITISVVNKIKYVDTYKDSTEENILTINKNLDGTYNLNFNGTEYTNRSLNASSYGYSYIQCGYYENPYFKIYETNDKVTHITYSKYSDQTTVIATLYPSTGDTDEEPEETDPYVGTYTRTDGWTTGFNHTSFTIVKESDGTYTLTPQGGTSIKGLTEDHLKGNKYVTGDITLTISGNNANVYNDSWKESNYSKQA
ncbi:MAG: InlB B-repeat-containing protein [Anaeroplasma bactoclasticum]|nr:InlB B-repeat-containing protein [Anaeroplasma bactoclasticum]